MTLVRKMLPEEEAGTFRVPLDGITALQLTQAYKRLVWAQDDVTTILEFLCREKDIRPDRIEGFDDERGELLIRP